MGPGFHSRIETEVFGATYPHVAFLDQPTDLNFVELVSWAQKQIRAHYQARQKPLVLVGHSFGTQILVAALQGVKDCIGEIRLLNSPLDSFDCFANLESHLVPDQALGRDAWKTHSSADKIHLILKLSSIPGFTNSYWKKSDAQKDYEQRALRHPALNLDTFLRVYTEYLQRGPLPASTLWRGPVQIIYSAEDVLVQDYACVQAWSEVFPQARFVAIPGCGHYAHFEEEDVARMCFEA